MAERPPSHRSEQTGDAALDRIQNNVRELIQFAKQFLVRVVGLESTHGTGKLTTVRLTSATRTLTADEFNSFAWLFVGTLAADCVVTVPRGHWQRTVFNDTTGGFQVTLRNQDGAVNVAASTGALITTTKDYGPETWL